MENLSVRFAKIVGTPTTSFWPQIHTYFPEDAEKQVKRGVFMAVLDIGGSGEGVEMAAIGREIISRLHEEYYADTEASAFRCLADTIRTVASEFNGDNLSIEIVGGALLKNILYLAISGGGEVVIKRGNVIQKVISGKGGKEEITSCSGFVKPNDLVVLGTKQFFDLVPEGILRASLQNEDPEEIVEAITPIVYGKESTPQVAALIGFIQMLAEEAEKLPDNPSVAVSENRLITVNASIPRRMIQFLGSNTKKILLKSVTPFKLLANEFKARFGGETPRKGKKVFLNIALILIALLFFSLFMVRKSNDDKKILASYQAIYTEIQKNLDDGKAIADLNPQKAKELLSLAEEEAKQLNNFKIETSKTAELKKQIENVLLSITKEYQLSELETFFDLGLIRENGRGQKLTLVGDELLILDGPGNRVYGVNVVRKSGEVIAGSDLPTNLQLIAGDNTLVYCFGKEGISRTDQQNKKTEVVIKSDPDWGNIGGMKTFSGNLYLFDYGKKDIWRYSVADTGFSAKTGLVKDVSKIGFGSNATFSIDGSVWIVDQNGKIYKLVAGVAGLFNPKNLDKAFSNQTIIYTDENFQNLYLLDKGNSRLVVLKKSGEYYGQYLSDKLSGITDLVVREDLKKAFLLQDNKIYLIDLRI